VTGIEVEKAWVPGKEVSLSSPARGWSLTGVLLNIRRLLDRGKPGGNVEPFSLLLLLFVWVAASSGSGLCLALLAKRIHPGLSMVRLWLFYTLLIAMLVTVVFLIAWF
jgi:hypothetical protein